MEGPRFAAPPEKPRLCFASVGGLRTIHGMRSFVDISGIGNFGHQLQILVLKETINGAHSFGTKMPLVKPRSVFSSSETEPMLGC
ncbi:hypothetical protein NL676_037647 [Syzygium grande]|nr:hypothetical protein NL676_037647 [Syzygium grande]